MINEHFLFSDGAAMGTMELVSLNMIGIEAVHFDARAWLNYQIRLANSIREKEHRRHVCLQS